MRKHTFLIIAALAVVAYFLLRKKTLPSNFSNLSAGQQTDYLAALVSASGRFGGNDGSNYE